VEKKSGPVTYRVKEEVGRNKGGKVHLNSMKAYCNEKRV